MTITELVAMLKNSLMNLTSQKTSAERLGDFQQVGKLIIEIQEVESILVQTETLE